MNAVEYATQQSQSKYTLDKYMPYAKRWSLLAQALPKLKAEGSHALQLAARFDVASYAIYGDAMLDWVLMLYNAIKRIGSTDGYTVKKNVTVALDAFEANHLEALVDTSTVVVMILDSVTHLYRAIPHSVVAGHIEADTDEDGISDLQIDVNTSAGTAQLTNLVASRIAFRLVCEETEYDDYMAEGTKILYPSKTEIDSLLADVVQQTTSEDTQAFGFDRL